jgi:phage terminase small subunit
MTLFINGKKDKNSYPSINFRQEKFICKFLESGNATESAIHAGYSEKTAYSIGQRLLKNVEIMKIIKKHRKEISREAELTVSEVVKEIRQLALTAKSETNRLRAYDMLMKHLGGYVNDLRIIESLSDDQVNNLYQKIIDNLDKS